VENLEDLFTCRISNLQEEVLILILLGRHFDSPESRSEFGPGSDSPDSVVADLFGSGSETLKKGKTYDYQFLNFCFWKI
jgi:hypothetical protein